MTPWGLLTGSTPLRSTKRRWRYGTRDQIRVRRLSLDSRSPLPCLSVNGSPTRTTMRTLIRPERPRRTPTNRTRPNRFGGGFAHLRWSIIPHYSRVDWSTGYGDRADQIAGSPTQRRAARALCCRSDGNAFGAGTDSQLQVREAGP